MQKAIYKYIASLLKYWRKGEKRMIRLVVSDIDGTLIHTTDGPVPAAVFEQISRLRAKGIIFAPASGRQYRSLRRLFAPLAGELHYICENGAVVFGPGSPGAVLSKVVMEHGEAMALARKIVATPDCELFMSDTNTSYLCPKGPEIVTLMRDRVRNNVVLLERPEDVPEAVVKVSAYRPGAAKTLIPVLTPHFGEVFNAAIAGDGWLDFTLADKGLGLRRLCAALGIDTQDVMAFGDNYNDLPMLAAAGHPYIMSTASPELLPRVENKCRDVAEVLAAL